MRSIVFLSLALSVLVFTRVATAQNHTKSKQDPFKKEIAMLAGSKPVVAAFQHIDALEPVTLRELVELTEIPAPPFHEMARSQRVKQMLADAGADKVWIDSVGNVLALRNGKKATKTIVLDAHLDTVFPEGTDVTVKSHGDTLFAPGISDDTRGLVVLVAVLKTLEKAQIETNENLLLVASAGEEGLGDLRGVKYIMSRRDLKIDEWISIDGTNIEDITVGALGSVRYKVTVKGPGGHSWGAFGLGNPHHAMAKGLNYFADAALQFTTSVGKTSFNVGRTGGGTSVNAIPFESWAEVDMRSESPTYLRAIDSLFKTAMARGVTEYNQQIRKGPAMNLVFAPLGYRPSGRTPLTDPLVARTVAIVQYMGKSPSFATVSTNSNIAIAKGIPAITIGAGGKSDHAHALNEWWINDHGADGIKFALLVTLAQTGVYFK